ncbi:hypothetical protein [Diaphorobacter aerolatus]|uniref:hypothetical protein n=1 Tax=Diaphorobacter aerolatus TaxID=1288495 RepID=UPI001D02D859|nr:hypothetical protein [Diaphorobacter aerolatus]
MQSTMMTVLVTVLLCLLVLALLFKYGLRYYVRRRLGGLMTMAAGVNAGPAPIQPRITMELEKLAFRDPLVRSYMDELKMLSYRSSGRYSVPEMPQLRIWSGTHHKDGSLALVMECGEMFTCLDVIRFHEDGGVLGVGTNPFYRPENYPPHMSYRQFRLGTPAREIVEWLRDQPVQTPVIQVTPKNLRALNTRFYAECTDFQLAHPLPSLAEYRARVIEDAARLAKPAPVLNEAQWRMGHERHRTSLLDALDGALKDHLLKSHAVSASEWDQVQYDIVFIHDRLTDEDVATRALARSEWTADHPEVQPLMGKGIAPAKLFDAIQALLPHGERFSFLATVSRPVASRAYAPEVEPDSVIETRIP